jgi:hypothetical protein
VENLGLDAENPQFFRRKKVADFFVKGCFDKILLKLKNGISIK